MMTGFYNGVAGIKTATFGTDVVANNISNVNTVGFKSSTPEFKTIFAQTLNAASQNPVISQQGVGSTAQTTALNMRGGSYQHTDGVFDMAIMGDGFFGIAAPNGQTLFTRDGSFYRDVAGDIVNNSGFYLLGTAAVLTPITLSQTATQQLGAAAATLPAYTVQTGTNITLAPNGVNAQTKINLPDVLYIPPEATTNVSVQANLDSSIVEELVKVDLDTQNWIITPELGGSLNITGNLADTPQIQNPNKRDESVEVTITDANGASIIVSALSGEDGQINLSGVDASKLDLDAGDLTISAVATIKQQVPNEHHFSTDIFSPNGGKNLLKLDFYKTVPQAVDSTQWSAKATITNGDGDVISEADGEVLFNDKGALVQNTLAGLSNDGVPLAVDLGTIFDPAVPNSGYDGIKSISGSKLDLGIKKDGAPEGLLKSYAMSDNGEVLAVFDNGKQASMGKIALYHFQNDQGLAKVGETAFSATANSGAPIFFLDNDGNVIYGARLQSQILEMSNVDLGVAMTDLITLQKAFDSSSKSITTGDEMIKTAINMKR